MAGALNARDGTESGRNTREHGPENQAMPT